MPLAVVDRAAAQIRYSDSVGDIGNTEPLGIVVEGSAAHVEHACGSTISKSATNDKKGVSSRTNSKKDIL